MVLSKENSTTSTEAKEKKKINSKTSVESKKHPDESINLKRPKSSSGSEVPRPKNSLRHRPKTAEENQLNDRNERETGKILSKKVSEKSIKNPKESSLKNQSIENKNEEPKSFHTIASFLNNLSGGTNSDTQSFTTDEGITSEKQNFADSVSVKSENLVQKTVKPKGEQSQKKRPSEIPKLISLSCRAESNVSKTISASSNKIGTLPSKIPIKTPPKVQPKDPKSSTQEFKHQNEQESTELSIKSQTESVSKTFSNASNEKKEKEDEKIKEALKENFDSLVPACESELKKITEVWMNTVYCTLTMRKNLAKLLFQAFPQINTSQFHMEDEKLLDYISKAKKYTQSEAESLIQFIGSLMINREAAKKQYTCAMANKEIAEVYNYDWRNISRKIQEVKKDIKMLHVDSPKMQYKRSDTDAAQKEKIQSMEMVLATKEDELQKLTNQLNILKQKESICKSKMLIKAEDYKDIKNNVIWLKTMEKELQELKKKFLSQNEMYENIKDLEFLLEDKKKILEKEKEMKNELQKFLNQFQSQQKRLSFSFGKEHLEFMFGQEEKVCKEKRQEQLRMIAIKLVLKGFLVQMKKLERDRNKMLLKLQSNDSANFNALATSIIKKDSFIQSIKYQMNDFQKACQRFRSKNPEKSCIENQ